MVTVLTCFPTTYLGDAAGGATINGLKTAALVRTTQHPQSILDRNLEVLRLVAVGKGEAEFYTVCGAGLRT